MLGAEERGRIVSHVDRCGVCEKRVKANSALCAVNGCTGDGDS